MAKTTPDLLIERRRAVTHPNKLLQCVAIGSAPIYIATRPQGPRPNAVLVLGLAALKDEIREVV